MLSGKLLQVSSRIREGLRRVAEALGIPLSEVVQLYASFTPSRVRILEVVEEGDEVVGIRMRVASGSRRGEWYLVAVGYRGWRCSCEAGRRGKLCKHAKLAVITWEILNIIRYDRHIDFDRVMWLNGAEQSDGTGPVSSKI